jgi:hypothetical protein
MTSDWQKLRTLGAADRSLVIEAAMSLVCVSLGLRLLPFPILRTCLDRRSRGIGHSIDRITWSVKAAGRRLPGTTCLAEALVVHSMLRRYGHAAELRLGVRDATFGKSPLDAHAWVECNGTVVIGTVDKLSDYAVLS